MLSPIKSKFILARGISVFSIVSIFFSISSCRKLEHEKIIAEAEPFKPRNLYPVERIPAYFNRVVILPNFHFDQNSQVLKFSDEIFHKELSKVGIFEPILLSKNSCLELFGKEMYSSSESLPDNFLKVLVDRYSANGVLFIDLHSFSPYRPMSLGVRSKLVDLKSGEFMWAIDETFDSGNASVMVAINNFQRSHHVQALSDKTTTSVLQSPRFFCKYVAHSVFSTLPKR